MKALFNGVEVQDAAHAIAVNDRGLAYGDGLFETALIRDGAVRFLDAHLERLRHGCDRLDIEFPHAALLEDIDAMCSSAQSAVLKIIVTRGTGGRGYRGDVAMAANRLLALHALPAHESHNGLVVRWCDLRLSRNATLAGLKHLNRLEQVLAQREWREQDIDEGLMLDTEGELVGATAGNVFIVRHGTLLTPDLRFCGVRGVMREQVLRVAAERQLPWNEEPLWPHDLEEASEVFVTNAIRGIRPVVALEDRRWRAGPIAEQLSVLLKL